MEKQETLDIIALVKNHPLNKLSNDDNGLLVNKIKERFTNEDQQLFVANFYCYLNYDTRKDYVVELDKIWKWIGFSQKVRAKELLVNNFTENKDYVIENNTFSREKVLQTPGRPEEIIKLTVHCFKKLCLKAKTKKSDEIHEYYVNLEEVVNELAVEQAEELKNQLLIKDKELTNKDKENETTIINNFANKPVVYLIQISPQLVKFGYSNDIKRRMGEHRSEFGKDITIKTVFETIYNREFEQMIKIKLNKHIVAKNKQTELIQLSDNFTYQNLQIKIEKLKNEVNENLVPSLMKEIIELRQKVNELLTPNNLEVIELRAKVTDLELQLSKKSDISISELRAKNAELELKLSKENLEEEKLKLRKKELDLKYSEYKRVKNNIPHRIEDGIEQKFCPGILCREETGEDGKWLDLTFFGKASQNKDGLRNECKTCRSVTEKNNYKKIEHKMTPEELQKSKINRSLKLRTHIEDNKKNCSECNQLKNLTEFKTNGKYITGEYKYRSECTECVNKKRRIEKVNILKEI